MSRTTVWIDHRKAHIIDYSSEGVGPGMAKEEFRNHCEDHHPQLAKSILDVLPMKDHPSKFEILKASSAFYKKHDNWHGIE